MIREFDTRGGWGVQGARSCAHWLAWRLGVELNAARERVRVARALGNLAKLRHALAHGELTYAKVRALTRVDGELEFRRPNGWLLREAPPLPPVPDDPIDLLCGDNEAAGLYVDGEELGGTWGGERLNLGRAIDVMHPLPSRR